MTNRPENAGNPAGEPALDLSRLASGEGGQLTLALRCTGKHKWHSNFPECVICGADWEYPDGRPGHV